MSDLNAHIIAQTVALLEGKTTANMPIFSTFNLTTPAIVRDPTCWASGLDLSCVAYLPGTSGFKGVFITPRHIIWPFHVHPEITGTFDVMSLGTDGVVRTHVASGWTQVGTTDMSVGVLSADAVAVTPATILPTTYAAKFVGSGSGVPTLSLHHDNKASVGVITTLNSTATVGETVIAPPAVAPFSAFNINISVGDTGNSAYVIINGAPVLVMSGWHTQSGTGTVGGPNLANDYAALIAVIDTLSPGGNYRPAIVDLSGFANYATVTTKLGLESVVSNDAFTTSAANIIAGIAGPVGITCTNSGADITATFETTPTSLPNGSARNFVANFTYSLVERNGDSDTNVGFTLTKANGDQIGAGGVAPVPIGVPTTITNQQVTLPLPFDLVTVLDDTTLAGVRVFIDAYGTDSDWTIKNLSITYDYDAPATPPAAADVRLGTALGDGTAGTLDLPATTVVKADVVYDNASKTGTYRRRAFIASTGSTIVHSG